MAQLKSGSTVGGKQISTVDHTHTPESIGAEGAGAAAAVQENLDSHAGNSGIHVTSAEKSAWNGKAEGVHYHDERYYTEGEVNNLLAAKSDTSHTHTPASIGAAPAYTYSTTDLTAGSSALATGTMYLCYE